MTRFIDLLPQEHTQIAGKEGWRAVGTIAAGALGELSDEPYGHTHPDSPPEWMVTCDDTLGKNQLRFLPYDANPNLEFWWLATNKI